MTKNQKIMAIGIIAATLILLGLISVMLLKKGQDRNVSEKIVSTVTPTPTPTPILGETIMVTIHGFVPDSLTVKKGTYINFANFSETNNVNIESDDHPTHQKYPMLNVGLLKNNDVSNPVKYDVPGTYTYHNHLKPEQKGTIIIK